jgi:hypothetical protein
VERWPLRLPRRSLCRNRGVEAAGVTAVALVAEVRAARQDGWLVQRTHRWEARNITSEQRAHACSTVTLGRRLGAYVRVQIWPHISHSCISVPTLV